MRLPVALLLLLPALAIASPESDALIDRVIAAYGGLERLTKRPAYTQRGVLTATRHEIQGEVRRVVGSAERLLVAIDYSSGHKERRRLDGDHGWKNGVAARGPVLEALRLMGARLALPLLLHERRDGARLLESVSGADGELRQRLHVALDGTLAIELEIDDENGEIHRTRGVLRMGAVRMVFVTEYADFRRVDGRLFAFRENHFAMGRATGFTQFTEITTAPAVTDEELYDPDSLAPGIKLTAGPGAPPGTG